VQRRAPAGELLRGVWLVPKTRDGAAQQEVLSEAHLGAVRVAGGVDPWGRGEEKWRGALRSWSGEMHDGL
jgi:hypothetical protein